MGNKDIEGWNSLGNTLYVSPSAATYGEIMGGWRLASPGNYDGDFIDYLIENMVKLYQESYGSEYLVLDDVINFQHEYGYSDSRFSLKLHKLHAIYIVAFNKYLFGLGD